jgi:hypothetical protein
MTSFCPPFGRLLRAALGFVLLVLSQAIFAQGGPPLVTDDPGTPGNKHWEINVAYTQTKFNYGTVYELPHIDLNYGYGNNVQLKLEGPLTIFNGDRENYASLGYTDWGVKWRFEEETKSRPALSTYPQIIFVGNQGLARLGVIDPGTTFLLPGEALKTFGHLILDVEAGLLFRQFTGTEFDMGICGEYDVIKDLALLGEVHDLTSTAFVQDELIWNLGFKYDFTEHQSLICSAGRGFGPSGPDNPTFATYMGIQFRA